MSSCRDNPPCIATRLVLGQGNVTLGGKHVVCGGHTIEVRRSFGPLFFGHLSVNLNGKGVMKTQFTLLV